MVNKYKLLILFAVLFSLFFVSYSIDINSCQEINVSGIYDLTQNINVNSISCFNVSESNISFNCDGFTIDSLSVLNIAFLLENVSNITIVNCDFGELVAISFINSSDNVVYNNTFTDSTSLFDVNSVNNNFNTSIGNYWSDMVCNETINQSMYFRCIDPATYIVNTTFSIVDYAPLMTSEIIPPVSDTSLGPIINTCGLINSSGIYELNESITSSALNCINITSSDVVLDCKDYTITGLSFGAGIYINGSSNVSIFNCDISNFNNGVEANGVINSYFENITATGNFCSGINLSTSSSNYIINVTLTSNGQDVYFEFLSQDNIINNSIIDKIYLNSFSNHNLFNNITANEVILLSASNIFNTGIISSLISIDTNYNKFYKLNLSTTTITSGDWELIAHNNFNNTGNGVNVGNYWGVNCLESENRGGYFVCINPSSYTYNGILDVIDYAPLVSSLITPIPFANNESISSSQIINVQGTYILNSSITNTIENTLTIEVSNVSIDCQGNSVTSSFNWGIFAENVSNISINNCRFNSGNALAFLDSNEILVNNCNFTGLNSLNIIGSSDIQITSNFFNSTSSFISATNSNIINIYKNKFASAALSKMTMNSCLNVHFNTTVNSSLHIGNYWKDLVCQNTTTVGGYYICNLPSSFGSISPFIDYAPLSVTPIVYVNENDPFDDVLRDYKIRLKIDHDFNDDVVECTITLDDDYERDYTFSSDTASVNLTITKYIDDEFKIDCDDKFDEVSLKVYDEDNWVIYDETYKKEDKIEYFVGQDMYKFEFEVRDYNDNHNIDCDLELDNDDSFSYRFDEDSTDDELQIIKYFAEEVSWDCDETLDEIRVRIYDDDNERILNEDYDDNDEFSYIVGEGMYKLLIEIDKYDENDNIGCELILDDDKSYDYEYDEDTADKYLEIIKYFEQEFVWDCDEKIDDLVFTVYDEADKELLSEDKSDIKVYSFNIDDLGLEDVTQDTVTIPSSGSSSSSSSNTVSNSDDLSVIVGLDFDKVVEKKVDFNDVKQTIISVENSWFEKLVISSKKSVSDVIVNLKKKTYTSSNGVIKSDDFSYSMEEKVFNVYDMLSVENDELSNDDINEMKLTFKVKKSWLEENNYSSDEVFILEKKSNGLYEEIVPKVSSLDMDYIHYEVISDGFATYAILAKKENPAIEEIVVGEVQNADNGVTGDIVTGATSIPINSTDTQSQGNGTSIFITIGEVLLGILFLIGFIWLIK